MKNIVEGAQASLEIQQKSDLEIVDNTKKSVKNTIELKYKEYAIRGSDHFFILSNGINQRFLYKTDNITHVIELDHYTSLSGEGLYGDIVMIGTRGSKKCLVKITKYTIEETVDDRVACKKIMPNQDPLYKLGSKGNYMREDQLSWVTVFDARKL